MEAKMDRLTYLLSYTLINFSYDEFKVIDMLSVKGGRCDVPTPGLSTVNSTLTRYLYFSFSISNLMQIIKILFTKTCVVSGYSGSSMLCS